MLQSSSVHSFLSKKSRLAGLRDGRGRVKAIHGWKRRCPQCLSVKSILTASRTVGPPDQQRVALQTVW
jgi:hypothetical protein